MAQGPNFEIPPHVRELAERNVSRQAPHTVNSWTP